MLDDLTHFQKRWFWFMLAVLSLVLLLNRGLEDAEMRRNEVFEQELRIHDAALAEYTRTVEEGSEVYQIFSYLFNRSDGKPLEENVYLEPELLNLVQPLIPQYEHSFLRAFRLLESEEEEDIYVYADIVAFQEVLNPHYKNSIYRVEIENEVVVNIIEEMTHDYNTGGI